MPRPAPAFRLILAVIAALAASAGPALADSGELPSLVKDIAVCLALAGLLAVVFTRLKIPTIAAFIAAGIVAGPHGFGPITSASNVDTIAQLGFILLLFTIGLELDLTGLKKAGRVVLLTGLLQFPLTLAFGYYVTRAASVLGIGGGYLDGPYMPIYVGAAIAGSSTLLVIKLFQDAFELDSVPGRVALGLLVLQDLWAIVAIILQPSLGAPDLNAVALSFAGIALLGCLAAAAAILLLPIVLRWTSRSPEIALIGAVAWCFAIVLIGQRLGGLVPMDALPGAEHMTVGPGMAAMIAGAMLASLPQATDVIGKVSVVKDFFVTLFFVSVGIGVEPPSSLTPPLLALAVAIVAGAARLVIFFPLMYWSGLDRRNATVTSVKLAQISEFGLVLVVVGVQLKQLTGEQGSIIALAFVLTALATGPMWKQAYPFYDWIAPLLGRLGFREPAANAPAAGENRRIALLGFHRVASALLSEIERDCPDLVKDLAVVDFNVGVHAAIARTGAAVRYGDFSRSETLIASGVDQAEVIVSTVSDDLLRGIDNRRLVGMLRKINPKARIIANAIRLDDVAAIYDAGADYVYIGHIETGRAVSEALHRALNGTLTGWRDQQVAIGGPLVSRPDVMR